MLVTLQRNGDLDLNLITNTNLKVLDMSNCSRYSYCRCGLEETYG